LLASARLALVDVPKTRISHPLGFGAVRGAVANKPGKLKVVLSLKSVRCSSKDHDLQSVGVLEESARDAAVAGIRALGGAEESSTGQTSDWSVN